jgi:hypothetical protein
MIEIRIEGQLLYIAKDTSLQLEVQNSAFSVNRIEGDIVFTFDVPAAENDLIFAHARFVYIQRCKKYACTVSIGGFEIAFGDLYIQKATNTSYSCGLVINPFPADFAENKLCQNDYGNDYLISANSSSHKQGWLWMLAQSLQEDSIFKFPLFIDTAFYGSANKDFGWFLLSSDPTPPGAQSGFQASLTTNDNVGLDRCYVNRLFTTDMNFAIEEESGNRGIRVFNNNAVDNPNSFVFAPAIKLLWILENVIKNGGYQMIGNFKHENCIKKIYSQSLRALDGLDAQTETSGSGIATVTFSPNNGTFDDDGFYDDYIMPFDINGKQYYYFQPAITQDYQITVSINTYLPANLLTAPYPHPESPNLTYMEAVLFIFMSGYDVMPTHFYPNGQNNWNNGIGYLNNGKYELLDTFYKAYNIDQFKAQIGYNGAGFYTLNYSFSQRLLANNLYKFFFGKVKIIDFQNAGITLIDEYQNIEITDEIATYYKVYNMFANKIKFAEHVPALTNSDFISNICNAFGLSMFVDSAKGQIELSFFKDILNHAQAIDLSPYLFSKKTYIDKYEPKKYRYKIDSISSEDIDETKILPSVKTSSLLPDAFKNYGKICFIENENRFRIAVKVGSSVQNWVFRWDPYSGNNQVLEIGKGDTEDITPFKVPNMKIADEKITYSNLLLNIEMEGCSTLFNTGNKEFEMILINCLGLRHLNNLSQYYYYEHATPVCLDISGFSEPGVRLTPTGTNSIGETYAAPWLHFLASHERICHTFLLPISVFMEVLQLLKPQDVPISNQIRFVIIDSVKLMPIKMNFQFTEGSQNIIAEILFAKEKIEL